MRLSTETIGAHKIEIDVDGHGQFSAEFNDHTFTHKTRLELIDALKVAVKRADAQGVVEVTVIGIAASDRKYSSDPFMSGAGYVHAKLRGKHERQHNTFLLVTDDARFKPTKFKIEGWRNGTITRRLTDVETTEYLRLAESLRVATTALEDFTGAAQIKPEDALDAAREGGAK